MCLIDEAEGGWEELRNEIRRSRKPYRCGECSRAIAVGELYHYNAAITDGAMFTHRMCAQCRVAAEWLVETCRGYLCSGVEADLLHHWEDEPDYRKLSLGRLIVGMRRQWRRFDGCGLMPPAALEASLEAS